ncbi:hypothetical protein C8R45DRAFT_944979 [Mycena sanguinolenta]|nr:hypothetical protein C8R45DRAFT_944979 [Mycena sanguinolenta]
MPRRSPRLFGPPLPTDTDAHLDPRRSLTTTSPGQYCLIQSPLFRSSQKKPEPMYPRQFFRVGVPPYSTNRREMITSCTAPADKPSLWLLLAEPETSRRARPSRESRAFVPPFPMIRVLCSRHAKSLPEEQNVDSIKLVIIVIVIATLAKRILVFCITAVPITLVLRRIEDASHSDPPFSNTFRATSGNHLRSVRFDTRSFGSRAAQTHYHSPTHFPLQERLKSLAGWQARSSRVSKFMHSRVSQFHVIPRAQSPFSQSYTHTPACFIPFPPFNPNNCKHGLTLPDFILSTMPASHKPLSVALKSGSPPLPQKWGIGHTSTSPTALPVHARGLRTGSRPQTELRDPDDWIEQRRAPTESADLTIIFQIVIGVCLVEGSGINSSIPRWAPRTVSVPSGAPTRLY